MQSTDLNGRFLQLITQNAFYRKCLLNQKHSSSYLNDLYTVVSRQMGLLLVRPIKLSSRGYYHPSPSACRLSFRYGSKIHVFRGDDLENLTTKMIKLDLDLIPQDVSLRIQQGYFKTAEFPLESFKVTTKCHRSLGLKTGHERYVSEIELKFAIDCQGNAGEVIIKLEVRWLYTRRPFFLGKLDPLNNPQIRITDQVHNTITRFA